MQSDDYIEQSNHNKKEMKTPRESECTIQEVKNFV